MRRRAGSEPRGALGHRKLVVGAALAASGAAAAVPACYLAVLSMAAWRAPRRAARPLDVPAPELVVLVPAHDEEELIGRCVTSLRAQRYPGDRFKVVVVADNCSDRTAERAAVAGAQVLVRTGPLGGGKGAALRWAMEQVLATDRQSDAFVIVDADSITEPNLLNGLAERLQEGAAAVQGDYSAVPGQGTRSELRSTAFVLFHRVRFSGRAALGLPCSLVGNGMLLSRQLIEAHPWTAVSAAEDLEYSTDLRLLGVRPVFAPDARLQAPVMAGGRGAMTQRLRWEGGRAHVVCSRLPRLVRECAAGRGGELWDAALDLAVPPLGVLAVVVLAGTSVTLALSVAGVVDVVVLAPWAVGMLALPTHVLVGLAAVGAPRSAFRALLSAPLLVAEELVTRARLLGGTKADVWERTARPGEAGPGDEGRQRTSADDPTGL